MATNNSVNNGLSGATGTGLFVGATSPTLTANITFSNTGNRFFADFSNATRSNRLFFQSTTTNGSSSVGSMPNGSGASGAFAAHGTNDPDNSSAIQIRAESAGVFINSFHSGSASTQAIAIQTDGITKATFGTGGTLSVNSTITSGLAGTATGGMLLAGTTSGTVSVLPQAVAGTYNFNLPTTAGSSSQILMSAGGGSSPMTWSTATYPSTTTANQLLYSSATNTIGGLATANSAQLVTNSSGVPAWSSTMTNGQIVIGTTSGTPVAANITAGTGVTITNGGGSITVTASDSYSWIDVQPGTVVTNLENDTGYSINSGGSLRTLPLPTSAAVGQWIQIDGNSTGLWKVSQNANQTIHVINTSATTGVGGSIQSTAQWDSIKLRCVIANTDWVIESGSFAALTIV